MAPMRGITLLCIVVASCAFNVPHNVAHSSRFSLSSHKPSFLKMANDETASLLEEAARLKKEAEMLQKELEAEKAASPPRKSTPLVQEKKEAEPVKKPKTSLSFEQVLAKLDAVEGETFGTMVNMKEEGMITMWGSEVAECRRVNMISMTSQTGIRGADLGADTSSTLDDLKFSILYVTMGSFALAVLSGIVIGGNVGATLTYLFAVIPILFLGVGSTAPGLISAGIDAVKSRADPTFDERRVRHEAAHFLVGYLLGYPIKSYKASGSTNEVEFYDSVDGDDYIANPGAQLTKEQVAPLAVISMAGIAGECLKYGDAKGGQADLNDLQSFLSRVNPYIRSDEQQDITRGGLVAAYKMLKDCSSEYEAVVESFRTKKAVNECIAAIETSK
uniref:Peptidase M41 domain-containing protein n=1 Tax=Fibrocapsa japonica TaxID=94617 RepID=A0A7S2V1Y0_9STRA|mmetsp:Transcript_21404/g.31031  ORF Transcript_21404/g.31031 Transcript_21404/m.31031 type:complete len:389 (+) Transcript_21404:112-1278(+)